jgi:hypothetical protein
MFRSEGWRWVFKLNGQLFANRRNRRDLP